MWLTSFSMQLKQALASAVDRLEAADVGSPRMNAEVLLMFVLGVNRAYLYAHPERELSTEETTRYDEALAQRATGMPSQYITGHQEFWGLDFVVSPAVLIPRPETEHLVETVLELARDVPRPKIVDVGTGSGCVALALAHELKPAEFWAVDVSAEALEIARANAARLQLDGRVRFAQSNVLEELAGVHDFDFVVSNPPYVGFGEADKVQRSVRDFEPREAVFAGEQGLDVIGPLVEQAHAALKPGGWLGVEIGYSMRDVVVDLLNPTNWRDVRVVPDLQGIPRVVAAMKT
ncbi:MAG TPA: peptide chain release factor N(5)-glutamine methyltransferase [Terriglobales bacterium]|nr:peptide chain release factor N(5)-glutamine methyltransferase [Terriglobales bacterium]